MSRSPFVPLLAICGLALGAASCDRRDTQTAAAGKPAPPPAVSDQTSLWQIDVVQDGGPASPPLRICADLSVKASFERPTPELNGKPCVRVDQPVEADGTYSIRCRIDDQLYRVGAVTKGDRDNDFTVEMAVTRQDRKEPTFEQTRHYRRQGACPPGWQIGDSAAPGAAKVVNTLTGAEHSATEAPS